jgi:hypothetical protein
LEKLKEAGLEAYAHFLLPPLTAHLHLTPALLERAALLNELDLGPYGAYSFPSALAAINPSSRTTVEDFLKSFFAQHHTIPLSDPSTLTSIARRIIIPVSVPPLQVVHTVSLNLRPDIHTAFDAPYLPPMLTVGQTVPSELVISSSTTWDPSPAEKPLTFFYEIQNKADTWLVSGRRRGHFVGDEGMKVGLLLVPTRSGELALPEVVVKCVSGGEVAEEVDLRSGAATVLVLPDVRSTTVRIGEGELSVR